MEIRFGKEEFASRAYDMVVKRIIDCGVYSSHLRGFKVLIGMSQTTTCCYYGTLHLEATKILARIVNEHGKHFRLCSLISMNLSCYLGQRAFVGVRDFCGDPHIPGVR